MRFGAVPRATPRQSDLMIVAGTLTYKMAAAREAASTTRWPSPSTSSRWARCSNCGGLFQLAYSVCKGVDKVIPVDVYVPGCPPRPEALHRGPAPYPGADQAQRALDAASASGAARRVA